MKIIVRDNINDNAKRMKDSVESFPHCSTKGEMMTHRKHKEGSPERVR